MRRAVIKHESSLALVQDYQMAQRCLRTRPLVQYECDLTLISYGERRKE